MKNRFYISAAIVIVCLVLTSSLPAIQTGPMVPVRKPDTTVNSAWRSLSQGAERPRSDQDHSPLPPPLVVPNQNSHYPESQFSRSSFGESLPSPIPQDNYEEIIGTPVSQDDQVSIGSDIEVIYEYYDDGKVQIKRHMVQDEHGNYLRHGIWQLFNRREQVLAEGKYDRGLMQGAWKRWHPQGVDGIFQTAPFNEFRGPFLSQATFYEGELHGVWEIYDQYRRKIFEMPYKNGMRHGTAVWYRLNGMKLREMSFADGVPHGELIEWNQQNKVTRRDQFIEGHKVTQAIDYWRRKQKQTEDIFLEAKLVVRDKDNWWNATFSDYVQQGERFRHGLSAAWYDNGQPKMRGQYKEGLREGRFSFWHRNGQLDHTGKYENGLKNGKWTWWHPNGMKAHEGEFFDDAPTGNWTSWNPDGTIKNSDDSEFQSDSDDLGLEVIDSTNSGELRPPNGFEEIESISDPSGQ